MSQLKPMIIVLLMLTSAVGGFLISNDLKLPEGPPGEKGERGDDGDSICTEATFNSSTNAPARDADFEANQSHHFCPTAAQKLRDWQDELVHRC